FVAPLASRYAEIVLPGSSPARRHNLPAMMTNLVGRDEVVETLVRQLGQNRFMTIVGTGGVGTTSVALATADRLLPEYEKGVWLVDLAPLSDPRLVPAALARAIGRETRGDDLLSELSDAIRDSRMLLVLDNCERVIDAAAQLVDEIRRRAAGV